MTKVCNSLVELDCSNERDISYGTVMDKQKEGRRHDHQKNGS